jgi:prevent-host-death family protein
MTVRQGLNGAVNSTSIMWAGLIRQVNDDHEPVRINSKGGDAVLMSADDFDSWQETI